MDTSSEGYVQDKLLSFRDEIEYYLSNSIFKDISEMNYINFNSQVLQKKESYSDILDYFLILEFSFKFTWDELSYNFKGFEKNVSELYDIGVI